MIMIMIMIIIIVVVVVVAAAAGHVLASKEEYLQPHPREDEDDKSERKTESHPAAEIHRRNAAILLVQTENKQMVFKSLVRLHTPRTD